MKTYNTITEIPSRFAFATSNLIHRESDIPDYRAHISYKSALNAVFKSRVARSILRCNAKTA